MRLIDFVYHSTLGLRVMKKKKDLGIARRQLGAEGRHVEPDLLELPPIPPPAPPSSPGTPSRHLYGLGFRV